MRYLAVILAAAVLQSCTTPSGVATFADDSAKALDAGPPIFHDIYDSCVRRHTDAAPIAAVFLPAQAGGGTPAPAAACDVFAKQGDALSKASGVLGDYFRAMHQLAAFNTTSVSTPVIDAANNAALASQLSSTAADSVSKLAGLITGAFTAGYRQHQMIQLLRDADPSISLVTQALEDVVAKDYARLAKEEKQTLQARYQQVGDGQNTATVLLLNRAYTDDMNELMQRQAAADAFVKALQQIRDGHHKLAQNAAHLNAKDLGVALAPYASTLEQLAPTLRKGI